MTNPNQPRKCNGKKLIYPSAKNIFGEDCKGCSNCTPHHSRAAPNEGRHVPTCKPDDNFDAGEGFLDASRQEHLTGCPKSLPDAIGGGFVCTCPKPAGEEDAEVINNALNQCNVDIACPIKTDHLHEDESPAPAEPQGEWIAQALDVFEAIHMATDKQMSEKAWRDGFAFIRSVEAAAVAKAKAEALNVPMGVSQWREHGEKHGYWAYYLEQRDALMKQEMEEAVAKAKSEGYKSGYADGRKIGLCTALALVNDYPRHAFRKINEEIDIVDKQIKALTD